MLANSIAEMRTYGEGFIIADQSPGLMDMSVIRNTNTKIIFRLPERSDRELVGFAAGLDEEQVEELSKLKRGVAAIYQSDWVAPVLVQVNKCDIAEQAFSEPKGVPGGKNNFERTN
jgi:DNA helicase HerA-like ATPase